VQGALRHRGQLGTLRNLFANSLAEALDHYFTHPVVRGALAPIITAHAPDTAGTGYMLGYFAFVHSVGIRRFQGGTGALAAALAKSFVAAGGRIRTSAVVESLVMDGTRISGVRLDDGEVVTSGVVVSNCDPKTTLTRLVPPGALTDHAAVRAAHLPVHVDGVGELKLDVALSGRLELRRHQAWRADGLDLRLPMASWGTKESVDAAFRESAAGRFPEALPMLCTVPTALDPSQAPEGQDTLWVYSVTAPLTPHEPWDSLAPGAAKALLGDLSNFYSNVEELSIGHRLLGPPHLAHRFRATNGSTSHVDLDPFRMGPFRPGIGLGGYRTPIPGLFLTGAGTHPVPGISGVAGKLSAQTVLRTLRR
jgi:phytoene dehydrogenase-like protein